MKRLAGLISSHADSLAEMASMEMGKPLHEAKHEVLKCLTACDYYASEAGRILEPLLTRLDDGRSVEQRHEPLGVIMGVFPWNFPYWQIIRSAVPVLMAGNTMLVKPAPNVPQCALLLLKLFAEAGFPDGVIQGIFADDKQVATLIADDRVKACTLTGSEKAGSAVASQAAKFIKKAVLELGGSDPFLVLADADLDAAVKVAITSRFQNNGQSCISAKRFIVHQEIANTFAQKLTHAVAGLKLGNPLHPDTHIGPLARKDLKEKLSNQVNNALEHGAAIMWQQDAVPDKGYFFPPTILGGVTPEMSAFTEELFGPVISFYICKNEEEMITLANATSFGLGGSVWSSGIEKAKNIAAQIESGQVFINNLVRSDTRFPFGGVKKSGFGRELGEQGIKEFTYLKTVWW